MNKYTASAVRHCFATMKEVIHSEKKTNKETCANTMRGSAFAAISIFERSHIEDASA